MTTTRTAPRPKRRPAGFTLVEMVVAIGLIIFLVGLTVTAAQALVRKSEVHRTKNVITLLDTALHEWEISSGRKLRRTPVEGEAELWEHRELVLVIAEVLDAIGNRDSVKSILAQIDPAFVHVFAEGEVPAWYPDAPSALAQLDGFVGSLVVLDAWGSPVYATHPGRPASSLTPPPPVVDDDGTEQTYNEYLYGVARKRQVCFISAGPDRRFGLYTEFPNLQGIDLLEAIGEARKDNVASYEPIFR